MPTLYRRKGDDVQVNTEMLNSQTGGTLALLAGGGFVVTWTDGSLTGGDTSSFAVRAQLFDASGAKVGDEFLVNTTVTGSQAAATVAGLASGRFIITWVDASLTGGDTSSNAVRGQLFEANGTKVGSEFLVNTATTGSQSGPAVTELAGGGFAISWTDASGVGGDNNGSGIKAQLFDANGAKTGGEILVNTEIAGSQGPSTIIALGTGFAIVWQGATTFDSGFFYGSVRLQRFDASGAKLGTEQVVASAEGNFSTVNVTALGSGFIVTWAQQDYVAPGVPVVFDVHAQLYDANGAKVGGEFIVNTTRAGSQMTADVDLLPGGNFLITWQGPGAGISGFNIFGQVYTAAGVKVGTEFVIADGPGTQSGARVDVLPSGEIVVIWTDTASPDDSSGSGIVMQILTPTTDGPTDLVASSFTITETAREGATLVTLTSTGAINATFTYTIVSDSTGGAFAIDGDRLVVVDNSLLNFESDAQVEVRIRTTDSNGNFYEATLSLDIADTPEGGYAADAGEFLVNTTTAENQSDSKMVALANGGFLATWVQWPIGGNFPGETRAQLFDAAGAKVGAEFTIAGGVESLIALPGGGFAATGLAPDGSGAGIVLTFYDANGAPTGAAIPVNTTVANEQSDPSIALLPNGNFIVTWTDLVMSPTLFATVRGQFLDAAGNKIGAEFTIPSLVPDAGLAEVTALANGNFVVSYGGAWNAQIFTASGQRYGAEISIEEGNHSEPHIVALTGGGFVITYALDMSGGGFSGLGHLTAEIFDAEGRRIGDPVLISASGPSTFGSTSIAALPWGGFVVAWADSPDPGQPSTDDGIRAQVFDATGAAIGDQIFVNTTTTGNQDGAEVIVLASGDIVISWSDASHLGGDASGFSVKARIFSLTETIPDATPGPDTLNGTSGADVIDGLGGDDIINGQSGDDVLTGNSGNDIVHGGEGNDVITELEGTSDQLFGDNGNDSLIYRAAPGVVTVVLDGGAGDDLLDVRITSNDSATLTGGDGRDRIIVNGGEEVTIDAGDGDDLVQIEMLGTPYAVTLGAGADILFLGSYPFASGIVTIADFEAGDSGDAVNLADYLAAYFGPAGNPFTNNQMRLIQDDDNAILQIDTDGPLGTIGQYDLTIVFVNTNVASLTAHNLGGYSPDASPVAALSLSGTGGTDWYNGHSNDDVIAGNGGNDVLFGAAGNDTLEGGEGNDELHGQLGNDMLVGGLGDDLFYVGTGSDQIVEAAGEGNDRVVAISTYTLNAGAEVETIEAANYFPINLTGNAFAQTLIGNDGVNTLDGGGGADILRGGADDDTYLVDSFDDQVIETVGAGQGNDAVYTTVSYQLGGGQSVELLAARDNTQTVALNLFGNELANVIFGNNGANFIDGAAGADIMTGFGGDDIYAIDNAGDLVDEANNGGNDSIFTTFSYVLGLGASVETLAARDNSLTVTMNLFGNELNNVIFGNNGTNFIDGSTGADIMTGFGGDDIYAVDNAGDVVIEDAGRGNDAIFTTFSYVLGLGMSVETLASRDNSLTSAMNLFGNELDNFIFGNNGANFIDGGQGADTMTGFGGDDSYIVDNVNDRVVENPGGGNDAIYTTFSYALAATHSIETLAAQDNSLTVALNLTGNELGNTLLGNNGANILNGGGGADVLVGFGGADTFALTTAAAAGNADYIADFLAGTDKIALDDAMFSGIGTAGSFNTAAFVAGTAAADADDRIVYNAATGQLFYDADGSGAGAAVLLATLSGNPTLTASDFQVI